MWTQYTHNPSTVDEAAADELLIYIINTNGLSPVGNKKCPSCIGTAVAEMLRKRMARGTYDPSKAPRAWMPVADAGAKAYQREHDPTTRWYDIFNAATRRQVAEDLAHHFEQYERESGRY